MQEIELNAYKKLMRKQRAFSSDDMLLVYLALVMLLLICFAQNATPPKSTYSTILKDIDTAKDPQQSVCSLCKPIIKNINNVSYNITPVINYKISGMVVAKNDIFVSDSYAAISPIDIGLAWGKMAQPAYDKYMNYKSSDRFLHSNYKPNFPFTLDFLNSHVLHVHIIPANDNILRAVKVLKIKEKATMEGFFVNVTYKSGDTVLHWNSNPIRTATDAGTGEVFYVTRVRIGKDIYE